MIEEIETSLLKEDPLFIKNYENEFPDFKNFIANLIFILNTHYTLDHLNNVYCNPNKLRSLGDLFLITKQYFPEITLKEVMKELAFNVVEKIYTVIWCPDIKKRVFFKTCMLQGSFDTDKTIYYGNYQGVQDGSDEYGFFGDDYLNLLK